MINFALNIFFTFVPNAGGELGGGLRKAIDRDFGSFDKFQKAFEDAGAGILGSGWAHGQGSIKIMNT